MSALHVSDHNGPSSGASKDGPSRSKTCTADICASINNQCCYIVYLVGMYIYCKKWYMDLPISSAKYFLFTFNLKILPSCLQVVMCSTCLPTAWLTLVLRVQLLQAFAPFQVAPLQLGVALDRIERMDLLAASVHLDPVLPFQCSCRSFV